MSLIDVALTAGDWRDRAACFGLDPELFFPMQGPTAGETVRQETRHWDENDGRTHTLRTKEDADDYRYFLEPDLVPLVPSQEWIDRVHAALPMLRAVACASNGFELETGMMAHEIVADVLGPVLSGRAPAPPCETVAGWWPAWRSIVARPIRVRYATGLGCASDTSSRA